jgi:hypothetical protein
MEFLSFFVSMCNRSVRTSYALRLLILIVFFNSFSTLAQTEHILIHQSISLSNDLPDGLERKLEDSFIIKSHERFPGRLLRIKKALGVESTYWNDEDLGRTAFRIKQILRQSGYLLAGVDLFADSTHKKGVSAVYLVELGQKWTLGEISWETLQSGLPIDQIFTATLIQSGEALDLETLQNERSRISSLAQKLGYATFNEGYIHFELDTVNVRGEASVIISIRGQHSDSGEDLVPHKRMKIGNVFYDQSRMTKPINQEVLEHLVMFTEGGGFDPALFESTYRRLAAVPAVATLKLAKDYPLSLDDAYDRVDITVDVESASRYNLAFELDMTRADTRYGPLTKISWTDRNMTGRGDVLTWTATASVASTQPFSEEEIVLIPNSGEIGVQCSYKTIGIPPIRIEKLPKSTNAHSELIINGAVESRPEYGRTYMNFLYRIDWVENPKKNSRVVVDPLKLSYVRMDISEEFASWLYESGNPLLAQRFSDYATSGSSIAWSQTVSNKPDFSNSLSSSLEWSGLVPQSLVTLLGDVPLIKFLRLDASWVCKGPVRGLDGRSWATRIRAGSAWTGKGTEALPYDRGFFGGGANGVRGWPIRELGPGLTGSSGVGDMRLDASMELRVNWTKAVEIAVFADVGNVWTQETPITFNSLGLSSGLGFRYDFDFFLVRLDCAIRLHDPSKEFGARWLMQGPLKGGVHLGLGHPF